MSTEQEFEREWEQVKNELMKLKGHTVKTIGNGARNQILEVDKDRGIQVNRQKISWITWDKIEDAYNELRERGELRARSDAREARIGYGAFCRAVFAKLTTAEVSKDGRKTILRYVPEGRPPQLRSGNTLHEPARQP